jgi:hypothetical protein
MATEKVKIAFFKVVKSGFYKLRSQERSFCTLTDLLTDYTNWTKQEAMTLADTGTYNVGESESFLRCFSYDSAKVKNDFLLCNWNELPTSNGKIPTIVLTEPVGSPTVHFTDIPVNSTPGFASYFWFIPERSIFATIKFSNVLNGKAQMEKTLRSFLYKFSSYAVLDSDPETPEEDVVTGYRRSPDADIEPLVPVFKSSAYTNPGKLDEIRGKNSDITKMIRKNKLNYTVRKDRAFWQRLISSFGVKEKSELDSTVKVRYEVPFSPSREELEEIIKEWNRGDKHYFDDVGFKMKNTQQIYWLSSSIARDEAEINIERIDNEIVNCEALLNELEKNKLTLLRTLK